LYDLYPGYFHLVPETLQSSNNAINGN
jgi:hypothetical protein